MQIAMGQYAYRRADGLLPSVELKNVFFEKVPTNLKDFTALMTRPSLDLYATAGNGPCRCLFRREGALGGDAFSVSGQIMYRISNGGGVTGVGAVPGFGSVEMAASADMALIASDGALLQTDGFTVTPMAFPDNQAVRSVGYMNGYFLAVPVDSQRIYYTDLTTGQFEGTRFIAAERYPDNLEKIVVTSDEVVALGKTSTEIFVPTGIDTSEQPPFQRVEGRAYKKGCINRATAVAADNTVYWVGYSEDGGIAFYRLGSVPEVVSEPSLAERLKRADSEDMRAWCFGTPGHSFVVLSLGDQGTWAFDIATGVPFEWKSHFRTGWRAWQGSGVWDGAVLAGDDTDGSIWMLNDDGTDDEGVPIEVVVTAGLPITGRQTNSNVSFDCAVGQVRENEQAWVRLEYSDDQGRTWNDEGLCDLGETGAYLTRARWDRVGTMLPPARIFRLSTTSRVRMRVDACRVNEPY